MFRQAHLTAVTRRALQAVAAGSFGAALACLLGASGPGVLVGVVSTLVVLLSALHLYVRQQEAKATLHKLQMQAMAREHEQAHRHLDELRHIAFHDSLTGLPNRRRLHDRLQDALKRTDAGRGHEFSLLFLDFDHFKLINDTLGHRAGDEFLVRTSQMLQHQLRPQDMVARLGGDEFAILVEGLGCAEYAVSLAERMLKLLSQPMLIDGVSVNATASIGITSSRFGYAEPGDVLRDADIAMYRAKSAGKARYELFDVGLEQHLIERQPLDSDLGAFGPDDLHRPVSQRIATDIAAA
jgi:diguanylate cyclase (GGDEF)-like protein